jgi:hypothetical protein
MIEEIHVTNLVEIVKAYYEKVAVEGHVEASTEFISEDFRLIAGTIEIDRKRFIAIMASVYEAIPDLAHTVGEFQIRGEAVQLTDQPKGAFTSSWDGTGFGLPVIPPTGNAFQMAPMKWEITIRNGKITRLHDITLPSAESGLAGFFKALGTTLPAAKRWDF